ncbi:MAG: hypothetical protein J6T10_21405 [Methanobrevibacter sp.]|nr:hypothetical protein [Methanobrevibacter sp.]
MKEYKKLKGLRDLVEEDYIKTKSDYLRGVVAGINMAILELELCEEEV